MCHAPQHNQIMRGDVSKSERNYWIDIVLTVSFVLCAISGLFYLLPPAPGTPIRTEVLGIGFRFWSDLHTYSGLVMVGGVGLHLVLHWRWLIAMTKKMLKRD